MVAPQSGISIEIRGADQLVDLSRRMKAAGQGELKKQMNKEIRDVAKPVVKDLRSAVRGLDSKAAEDGGPVGASSGAAARAIHRGSGSHGSSGLRDTIARAIRTQIKLSGNTTGVRIEVNKNRLPPEQRKLPQYLNRPRGWYHPVFGNEHNWVRQWARPWWQVTIRPHSQQIRRDVLAILDRFERRFNDL